MELILTEDVPKVGKAGQVVKVKEGFGRNYLLPQRKALPANAQNITALERQKKVIEAKAIKDKEEATVISEQFATLEISVEKEVGANERLFGSVTSMDIVAALRLKGVEVDKNRIVLEGPIKSLGTYDISIKLHPEVNATFKLTVLPKSNL